MTVHQIAKLVNDMLGSHDALPRLRELDRRLYFSIYNAADLCLATGDARTTLEILLKKAKKVLETGQPMPQPFMRQGRPAKYAMSAECWNR